MLDIELTLSRFVDQSSFLNLCDTCVSLMYKTGNIYIGFNYQVMNNYPFPFYPFVPSLEESISVGLKTKSLFSKNWMLIKSLEEQWCFIVVGHSLPREIKSGTCSLTETHGFCLFSFQFLFSLVFF